MIKKKNYMMGDYLQEKYTQKERWYHFLFGLSKFGDFPLLIILFVPIVLLGVYLWNSPDKTIIEDMPQFYNVIWVLISKVLSVLIPALLSLLLVSGIGNIATRNDEALLQTVFPVSELRKGNPILIHKHSNKKGIITREFYTLIPFEEWKCREESIYDVLNEHPVEELKRGGKHNDNGNRIIIHTSNGRVAKNRGDIYDDDI